MPPLAKPHRVGILVPDLRADGGELGHAAEAALVAWLTLVEALQRHPALAIYDPDATPLVPRTRHLVPQGATLGATPTDATYGPARRDEVAWLEVVLAGGGKAAVVRWHVVARDGARRSFDAIGKRLGDQIDHVLAAWLSARELGPLPRRYDALVTLDELAAAARAIAPVLVERARVGTDDDPDAARGARAAIARIPTTLSPALRVAAIRVLELALRTSFADAILALEPQHPQALLAAGELGPDALRAAIAGAPCWARPHAELARAAATPPLAAVAAAGLAVMVRPGNVEVLAAAQRAFARADLADDGLRLLARAVARHGDSATHRAFVRALGDADRPGACVIAALAAAQRHGCPMDGWWSADRIDVDLAAADAYLQVGRLDEAIALRANRLEGREDAWPRAIEVLARWRQRPAIVAHAYAREGAFRGDPGRAVLGYGCVEPADDLDVALFLDALVACGREAEVPLAWAHHGLGRGRTAAIARLAAARGLMIAGDWRRGLEELWRVSLADPGRDTQVAIARVGLVLSCAPIAVAETALGDRIAIGATTLARRLARDIADFMPAAARSGLVARALGRAAAVEFELAWLGQFAPATRSRAALDALFAELARRSADDALARGDRLVERWLEVVFAEAAEDDPPALAQAAAYAAAQALARYLAATTHPPDAIAGALRTVAAEALALVRVHRDALADRDARALLAAIEPVLRRVDRWVAATWLAAVESACGLDERTGGELAAFARDLPTVAARLLGPEETAVLAASVARLERERPDGWAAATAAQAERLALHAGAVATAAWAEAVVAQHAAGAVEVDDAIDLLHTACYLAEGRDAGPCLHAARVLANAGRGAAALAVLVAGLHSAPEPARAVATLADAWRVAGQGVPLAFDEVASGLYTALQTGDLARAERLGRLAVALDPHNAEAHRNLGLALASQGKVVDALVHLTRATPEQATQILAGVLAQHERTADALAVLDYASRWYVRAEPWLTFGGVAYQAMDNPRTVRAYRIALQLDPAAVDASQLNAYAGVLDEVGDHATLLAIADRLEAVAGDDRMWLTCAWNHRACAHIGLGDFAAAVALAERAVADNPLPDNAAPFAATLERARTRTPLAPAPSGPPAGVDPEPAMAALVDGDPARACELAAAPGASWRARRAGLAAARFRFASENRVDVTPRARAASGAILADTTGSVDVDAIAARALALEIREQAFFPRDPVVPLGDRMTPEAFHREFRARGGVVLGGDAPPPAPFVDRVVIPGGKVARASDYVALLRDLAALHPRDALAQFDLDDAGYVEVATAWAAAIAADPDLAALIERGLARSP